MSVYNKAPSMLSINGDTGQRLILSHLGSGTGGTVQGADRDPGFGLGMDISRSQRIEIIRCFKMVLDGLAVGTLRKVCVKFEPGTEIRFELGAGVTNVFSTSRKQNIHFPETVY